MVVGMGMRDVLVIAFKYRIRVVSVFAGFVALAIVASILMTPIYASTTSLLIKLGRELVYRTEVGASTASPPPVIDKDEVLASNIAIMTSRDILERVIATVGLDTLYPDILSPSPLSQTIKGWSAAVAAIFGAEPLDEAPLERALRQFPNASRSRR